MRKAYVIIFFCIIFLIISISLGYYIYKISNINQGTEESLVIGLEKIEDECVEEAKSLKIENEVMASNVEERKVSPNATLIIKKYYPKCGHTTKDYAEIPQELVNLNEKEVAEFYKDWDLKGFSNGEIVLYKEADGICNEHYILKDENGFITIYTVDENGVEKIKEETKISTIYLPEIDLQELKEGVKLFGKEELNAAIEDFE